MSVNLIPQFATDNVKAGMSRLYGGVVTPNVADNRQGFTYVAWSESTLLPFLTNTPTCGQATDMYTWPRIDQKRMSKLTGGKRRKIQQQPRKGKRQSVIVNVANRLIVGVRRKIRGELAKVDWKSKTKAKAATLKREMEQTGGGPSVVPPLTDLETVC
nr:unnamed protein product [Callosobruchus chinensis]